MSALRHHPVVQAALAELPAAIAAAPFEPTEAVVFVTVSSERYEVSFPTYAAALKGFPALADHVRELASRGRIAVVVLDTETSRVAVVGMAHAVGCAASAVLS